MEFIKQTKKQIKEFLAKTALQSNQQKIELWLKISKACVFLIIFLLPLWFLPGTTNVLDFNKQILLVFLSFVSLLSFLFYSIREAKLNLNFNVFNLSVLGFLAILGISACFSSYGYASFWGWPLNVESSFLTSFCFVLLYFLIINLFQKNEILKLMIVFIGSVFLAVLFDVFQIFGKFLLPFDFSRTASFNTIGLISSLSILSASLLPLMAILIFISKRLVRIFFILATTVILFFLFLIDFGPAWLVLLISSSLILVFGINQREIFPANWLILPMIFLAFCLIFGIANISLPGLPTPPMEILLSYKTSFDVAIQSLKDSYLSFFFGFGPGAFIYNYAKFKPPVLNQTELWAERFPTGNSELLNKLATTGILGIVSFLAVLIFFSWLGFKELVKEVKEDQRTIWFLNLGILVSWLNVTIGMFLRPANFVLSLFFWFLMATFILLTSTRVKTFYFRPFSLQSVSFSFLFILILVLGITLLIFSSQRYFAEMNYYQALKAFQRGDSQKSLNLLIQATEQTGKKQDLYLREISQVYLTRISEEIQKQNVFNQETIQTITPLVNNLLDATKRATTVAPKNGLNWIMRGFAYRNIIGIFSGAEEWAEKSYQTALKLEPTNPYIYYEIGLVYLAKSDIFSQQNKETERVNDLKLASESFKKAIDLKQDYIPAHFQTALVLVREGKNQEAIDKLELIKQNAPFDVNLVYQLGLLYYNTDQFNKAKIELEKAVDLNPNYSNARYFLGLIYEKEGNKKAAIEQFEQIEKLNPGNQEVKRILNELRKNESALKEKR